VRAWPFSVGTGIAMISAGAQVAYIDDRRQEAPPCAASDTTAQG